jgi:predicted nuclease of predicted toxin-antitoxin system
MTDALKFLVDVGVGRTIEKWLSDNGFDVKTVRDINPRAKDAEILITSKISIQNTPKPELMRQFFPRCSTF